MENFIDVSMSRSHYDALIKTCGSYEKAVAYVNDTYGYLGTVVKLVVTD